MTGLIYYLFIYLLVSAVEGDEDPYPHPGVSTCQYTWPGHCGQVTASSEVLCRLRGSLDKCWGVTLCRDNCYIYLHYIILYYKTLELVGQ